MGTQQLEQAPVTLVVRELAGEFGLDIASKPDSQDICFVPEGDYTVAFTCEALDDMPDSDDELTFSAQRNVNVTAEQTEVADLPEEEVITTP